MDTVKHMEAELVKLETEGDELSTKMKEWDKKTKLLSSKKRKLDRVFRSLGIDLLDDGPGTASNIAYITHLKHYQEVQTNLIAAMQVKLPIAKALNQNKGAIGKKNRELTMAYNAIASALKKD
jgi:hypothetical protein